MAEPFNEIKEHTEDDSAENLIALTEEMIKTQEAIENKNIRTRNNNPIVLDNSDAALLMVHSVPVAVNPDLSSEIVISSDEDEVVFVGQARTCPCIQANCFIDLSESINAEQPQSRRQQQKSKEKTINPNEVQPAAAIVDGASAIGAAPIPAAPNYPKCSICLENPFENEPTTTTCGHVFCYKCIQQALKAKRKCPNCNKGLGQRGCQRLYL